MYIKKAKALVMLPVSVVIPFQQYSCQWELHLEKVLKYIALLLELKCLYVM